MKKIISIILAVIFSIFFIGCDACGIDGIQDEKVATQAEFIEFIKYKVNPYTSGTFSVSVDTNYEYNFAEKDDGVVVVTDGEISASGTFNYRNGHFISAKTKVKYEQTKEYTSSSSSREDEWYLSETAIGGIIDYEEQWFYDRYTNVKENGVREKTDVLTKSEGIASRGLSAISFPPKAKDILGIIDNVLSGYPTGNGVYFFIDGDDCLLIESGNSYLKKTALIYDGNELKKICVYSESINSVLETTYEFCDYIEIRVPSNASEYSD
jgi:hypothetical protein